MVTTISTIKNAPLLADHEPEEQVRLPLGRFAYLGHQNALLLVEGDLDSQLAELSQAARETRSGGASQAVAVVAWENRVSELVQVAMIGTASLVPEEGTALAHQFPPIVWISTGDAELITWHGSSSEPSLDFLATQLRIDLSLLVAVRSVLRKYIARHSHLTLAIEPLTDPELAGPIEAVFEIRGTGSSEETNEVWEDVEALLRDRHWSRDDWEAIMEKTSIHVHRATV